MASLERVVDALNGDNLQDVGKYALSAIATGDLLQTAPDGSKHKLKVKISSMLKSSGTERAFGAQLARAAIGVDWSFIKSHGGSWAAILTHVLDLPDPVGWEPAILFLSTLTTKIHGKQELVREVTNAKISDFIKRLVIMLDKAPGPALDAFAVLLQLYPGACRAYTGKIKDRAVQLLKTKYWKSACAVISAAPWVEKNPASAWRELVSEVLQNLLNFADDKPEGKFFSGAAFRPSAQEKLWYLLASLVGGPKPTAVKLPASKLANLLDQVLRSLDPDSLDHVCTFFVNPKVYFCLESFYIRQFEMLLHHFVEATQLSQTLALKYAKCASLLIGSSWVSSKFNAPISRLVKHVISAAYNTKPCGVEGLSDFVSHPEAFERRPEEHLAQNVDELLQAIILNVTGLNNATRAEIDSYFISTGRKGLNAAALYPGKFSVLPIALNIGVEGLECLIHPRFPPLPAQTATLDKEEEEEEVPMAKVVIEPITIASKESPVANPVDSMPKFVPEPQVPPTQSPIHTVGQITHHQTSPGHDHSLNEIASPHFEPAVEPDMPIPEPSKPQPEPVKSPLPRRVDSLSESRPEKRPRLTPTTPTKNTDINSNDDDEDEFVMPTLQMDSD